MALIVLEATGGYESGAALALQGDGLALAIVNPRQARDFARAMGYLAKTDRIDARALAELACVLDRHPDREKLVKPLPDAEQRQLQALMARRRQPVSMLVSERNRLSHEPQGQHPGDYQGPDEAIGGYRNRACAPHCHHHADLAALLSSVTGVGNTTAATLIADVPELGQLSRREISALIGVEPLARDSGLFRGQRTSFGGRAEVRCTLYRATLVATRHNPVIKRFYEPLLTAGKAKKVALVACRRKLLTPSSTRWSNPANLGMNRFIPLDFQDSCFPFAEIAITIVQVMVQGTEGQPPLMVTNST